MHKLLLLEKVLDLFRKKLIISFVFYGQIKAG